MRFFSASPAPRMRSDFAGGIGLDHGDLAVGGAADAPRGALAFGAELGRLPLPLGLHAAVDRLHVGFRQIDALDAHVDDIDAKRLPLPC